MTTAMGTRLLGPDPNMSIIIGANNNFGNTVNYQCSVYEPQNIMTVGIQDQCADYLTFTDVAGNVSRATYVLKADPSQVSDRHGPIKALYLPSGGTTTPLYQFGYDNVWSCQTKIASEEGG